MSTAPSAESGTGPDSNTGASVYMTTQGGEDTTEAVSESGAFLGVESSLVHRVPGGATIHFLDYPFTDPDATFSDHRDTVQEHRPALTVAPDVERGRTLSEVIEQADKLSAHAGAVIIVPKSVHPSEVPDRFRVGVPAANYGTSGPWTTWDYRDCGPVHILGGPPSRQLEIGQHLPVASVDTATLGQRCRFGMWDGGAVHAPDGMDYKQRLRASLDNYASVWGGDDE